MKSNFERLVTREQKKGGCFIRRVCLEKSAQYSANRIDCDGGIKDPVLGLLNDHAIVLCRVGDHAGVEWHGDARHAERFSGKRLGLCRRLARCAGE